MELKVWTFGILPRLISALFCRPTASVYCTPARLHLYRILMTHTTVISQSIWLPSKEHTHIHIHTCTYVGRFVSIFIVIVLNFQFAFAKLCYSLAYGNLYVRKHMNIYRHDCYYIVLTSWVPDKFQFWRFLCSI